MPHSCFRNKRYQVLIITSDIVCIQYKGTQTKKNKNHHIHNIHPYLLIHDMMQILIYINSITVTNIHKNISKTKLSTVNARGLLHHIIK